LVDNWRSKCSVSLNVFSVHLTCSAAHPAPASLHRPITVAEYYIQRKINKKAAKTAGKVIEKLVYMPFILFCFIFLTIKEQLRLKQNLGSLLADFSLISTFTVKKELTIV